MHSVMILAAGLGSRLRPLTDELPKALMPVGNGPLLARLAARLQRAGYLSAVVNTHHRAQDFRSVFQELPLTVEESFELDILGTAGGIAKARPLLKAPLLVHNADIDCELDYERLRGSVAKGGVCLAVCPRLKGEGSVGVDAAGRIVRLRGEQFGTEELGGDYVGVAALADEVLQQLPSRGCLIGDVCLPRLRTGLSVMALCETIQWNDIGSLATYVESNFRWLKGWQTAPNESFVAPSARVAEGVVLRDCVVGAGARVLGTGTVERCIVWPNAEVTAPLADRIVTGGQQIIPFVPS